MNINLAKVSVCSFERSDTMFKTDPPYDEMESVLPEWHEPFPQPQTIPSGWDITGLLSATMPSVVEDPELSAEA
jgi:hypothetical protein